MATKKKQVLEVDVRESLGSAASRRELKSGKVPAVVYGHGADPKHLLLNAKQWITVSKQDVQIVELKQKTGENINVLIKEVQINFLTGAPKHVDFLEVKMDEIITAFVPIHGIGTPIGLSQGGVLEQQLHEVEINCTPLTLPESLEIDISELEIGSSAHASDLTLPETVSLVSDSDQILFQVAQPKTEEESEAGEDEGGAEGEEVATEDKGEDKKEDSE